MYMPNSQVAIIRYWYVEKNNLKFYNKFIKFVSWTKKVLCFTNASRSDYKHIS